MFVQVKRKTQSPNTIQTNKKETKNKNNFKIYI